MTDTDWEEYYLNDDNEFDSVAPDPKPLPCWCRGVERVPLEKLPLFQYLKEHGDSVPRGPSPTHGCQIRGLGRARPRSERVMPAEDVSDLSDEGDWRDYVGSYWRRNEPLEFGMSRREQRRDIPPSSSSRPHTVQPPHISVRQTNGEAPSHEPPNRTFDERNVPRATRAKSYRHRRSLRQGSFNPQEYSEDFGLNHWVQAHASKGSSHAEGDSDDDEDDESVLSDARNTSVSSSSTALSSNEESKAPRNPRQGWRVLEVRNLPSSVTVDELGELLANFGVVEDVTVKQGGTGTGVAVVRMANEGVLDWIQECLLTTSPFGTSSKPLDVRILDREV